MSVEVLLTAAKSSANLVRPTPLVYVSSDTNTGAVTADASLEFVILRIIAAKAVNATTGVKTLNTGNIQIGAQNSTGSNKVLTDTMAPGEERTFEMKEGYKGALKDIICRAEISGDGVVIVYH